MSAATVTGMLWHSAVPGRGHIRCQHLTLSTSTKAHLVAVLKWWWLQPSAVPAALYQDPHLCLCVFPFVATKTPPSLCGGVTRPCQPQSIAQPPNPAAWGRPSCLTMESSGLLCLVSDRHWGQRWGTWTQRLSRTLHLGGEEWDLCRPGFRFLEFTSRRL